MHRWLRQLALGTVASLTVACQTYRPVTAPRTLGGEARLRITFAAPRELQLARDSAMPDTLHDVWRLEGRLVAIVVDTVRVDVDEAYDARGKRLVASGRASVVPDAGATIERRELSAGRTLATGLGLVLLLSTVAMVLLIATLVRAAE